MAQTPPYITCRATTIKCGHRANNYILIICENEHISEIALCEAHTGYNNVHQAPCPNCRQPIKETLIINIADVMNKHLAEYIFHALNGTRGAIIMPDCCLHEDLPKRYLHHISRELGGSNKHAGQSR